VSGAVETPSGKTAKDENFPVGSRLLAADKRPRVLAYYTFARAIDDIADNPGLSPDDKVVRLKAMADAVETGRGDPQAFVAAHAVRTALIATGLPFEHATDLIIAFERDACSAPIPDWAALMDYCRYSAAPVGRFLLDLHGEDRALWPAADALCAALQVLNHLQDCAKDWAGLRRLYLPADWMAEAGCTVDDLTRAEETPALRRVLDRCLDGVDELLALARTFPPRLASRRLAMESAVIVRLAFRLAKLLRAGDPVAERVALAKTDFLFALRGALVEGIANREAGEGGERIADPAEHVETLVRRSGSSFTLGMRILPRDRRHAMHAIYAFCREVDDAADEPNPPEVKLALLDGWRREVAALYDGTPSRPAARALYEPVRRFALPRAEFLAVIDGMEMDIRSPLHAPDWDTLRLYCRRVAGAVGVLSLGPFGAEGEAAHAFALALGEALQLTNILRDLAEDGELGRLYLPREALAVHGIDPGAPAAEVLRHPGLDGACHAVAAAARERFAEADAHLRHCDRRALRPALLMLGVYEDVLDRLERRGWAGDLGRIARGPGGKLRAALVKGLWRPQR
jgi:hydroxysqualene synthase